MRSAFHFVLTISDANIIWWTEVRTSEETPDTPDYNNNMSTTGYEVSGIICCSISLVASISIFFYFFCIRIRKLNESLYNKVILGLILCEILASIHFILNIATSSQHNQIGYYSSYLCQVDGFIAAFIFYMIMLYNYQLSHAIQTMYDEFNPGKVKAADYHLQAVILALILSVITIPLKDIGRSPFDSCGIMMGSLSQYLFAYVAIIVLIYCIYSLMRIAGILMHDKTILKRLREDMHYHIMNVVMYIIVWFQFALVELYVFLNKGFNSTISENKWIRAAAYFAYLAGFLSSILRMATDPRLTQAYSKWRCCRWCYKKTKASASSDPQIFQNNVTVLASMLFSISRFYKLYEKDPDFADCVHGLDKQLPEHIPETFEFVADTTRQTHYLPDTSRSEFQMKEINSLVTEHHPFYLHRVRLNDSLTLRFFEESLLPSRNVETLSKFLKTESKGGQDLIVVENLKLIIKTVSPTEKILLLDKNFLHHYTRHLQENPESLLIRKYGFFSFEFQGKKFSSIVMENVGAIPKELLILKFDLKFSRRNRSVLRDRDYRLLPGYLLNKSGVALFEEKLVKNIYQFGTDERSPSNKPRKSMVSISSLKQIQQCLVDESETKTQNGSLLSDGFKEPLLGGNSRHDTHDAGALSLDSTNSFLQQQFKQELTENEESSFRPFGTNWNDITNGNKQSEKNFKESGGSVMSQDHPLKINDSLVDYGIFAQEGRERSHRVEKAPPRPNLPRAARMMAPEIKEPQQPPQFFPGSSRRQIKLLKPKLPYAVAEIERDEEGRSTSGEGKTESSDEKDKNCPTGSYQVHGVPLSALNKYNEYYSTLLEEEESLFPSSRQTQKTLNTSSILPGQIWRHARNYKPSVMKDKDFEKIFNLRIRAEDRPHFAQMVKQCKKDCDFLEKHNLMDYSILIFVARVPSEKEGDVYTEFQKEIISLQQNNRYFFFSPSGHFVYFMAIIDFLGSYDLRKKGEAGFKALIADDGDDPSAVHPGRYRKRFMEGMERLLAKVQEKEEEE